MSMVRSYAGADRHNWRQGEQQMNKHTQLRDAFASLDLRRTNDLGDRHEWSDQDRKRSSRKQPGCQPLGGIRHDHPSSRGSEKCGHQLRRRGGNARFLRRRIRQQKLPARPARVRVDGAPAVSRATARGRYVSFGEDHGGRRWDWSCAPVRGSSRPMAAPLVSRDLAEPAGRCRVFVYISLGNVGVEPGHRRDNPVRRGGS